MKSPTPQYVIWDWNGTLLDDVGLCLKVMNSFLSAKGRSLLNLESYRRHFTIPVADFYTNIGINFESETAYQKAANDFHDEYEEHVYTCQLHTGAKALVALLKQRSIGQSILSGLPHNLLERHLSHFGIRQFFDVISGAANTHARGKLDRAQGFMEALRLKPEQTILIGDTIHDAEVSQHLGIRCLLVASGCYSAERLAPAGFPVLTNLTDVALELSVEME